ncbi:MAG TPA: hypothetical protein VF083_00610, partial [Acidimicrobiia bacterium]
ACADVGRQLVAGQGEAWRLAGWRVAALGAARAAPTSPPPLAVATPPGASAAPARARAAALAVLAAADLPAELCVPAGVPVEVARQTVAAFELVHAPDMIEVSGSTGRSPIEVAGLFHHLGHVLELDELERVVAGLKLTDPWQRWAGETIEDDLLSVRRSLALNVLEGAQDSSIEDAVQRYIADRADAVVWISELIRSLDLDAIGDPAPLLVVVRQIQNLAGLTPT